MPEAWPESETWDEFPVGGSLTAAEVAALAAADADGEGCWEPADPDTGMPDELRVLSARELAGLEAIESSWPVTDDRAAGPQWPLSYRAAGCPGGPPSLKALFRDGAGEALGDGAGEGLGFAGGGALDTAPASLTLAGFADEAYEQMTGLDDDSLIGVLRAYRRLTSQAQARELALVAELVRRRPEPGTPPGAPGELPPKPSEFVADEIAPALTLTSRAAAAELGLALGLVGHPATAAALESGRIDMPKALVILEMLAPLDPRQAAAVEASVLPLAGDMTTGQLRARLRREVLAADPDAARRRQQQAEKQARVEHWSDPEGTATLAGRSLPPAEVLAADRRLCAIARQWQKQGAQGGMDLLRARAYLALLLGLDISTPPASLMPTPTASQPAAPASPDRLPPLTGTVNLTVPLSTLLDLADRPGEVPGFGPLHADTCRDLADAMARHRATRWCVTITDPNGYAVAFGGPARARPTRGAASRGTVTGGTTTPGSARGSPIRAGEWAITLITEAIAPGG